MDQFKDGYRIIMLVNRDKESRKSTTDRKNIRYITENTDKFNYYLHLLRTVKETNERIYVSVNSRNMASAIRLFKKRQLDNDYTSDDQRFAFYCDIGNRFISCLQSPEARLSRNFLIDFDTKDETYFRLTKDVLQSLTTILHIQPTPNGFHFVTEPFDSTQFSQSSQCTLIKDGMLFIE